MKPHSAADCDRTMVSVDTEAGSVRELCAVVLVIAPLLIVAGNTAPGCNSTGPAHEWRIASRNRGGEQMPIAQPGHCALQCEAVIANGEVKLAFTTAYEAEHKAGRVCSSFKGLLGTCISI
jgi:hypothetical protein